MYIVMIKPTWYISLPPSTFNEGIYNVPHNTENCVSSIEVIESENTSLITCPSGELLLDQVMQPNLSFVVSDGDIQLFNIWSKSTIPLKRAFITLQFLNSVIVTRLVMYCLILEDLKVREPKNIRLFLSNMESTFPTIKIKADTDFTVTSSGRTTIQRMNNGDNNDDDDNGVIHSTYEYGKYDLVIPNDQQTLLRSLRISMEFEGDNWIFISEVEAYHIEILSESFMLPYFYNSFIS